VNIISFLLVVLLRKQSQPVARSRIWWRQQQLPAGQVVDAAARVLGDDGGVKPGAVTPDIDHVVV
jgi:hypothetical protein